ncbi:helix-turn-helix transcriptional regulator [Nitratidesulfovibrio liaohensis]|uniref:Helix-turn-helix domain-containing protein n=1 Tax=Nitratidesulfovibrio liaohensis TaxID=2604158 RepID=A0ABY9R4D9_9BACT|nr:helix-turn-helix transcriptional regulator [Nitratidesulfovibrio liaohensis]WMW66625.1 helix-turn-helix domain-containing protein [Nitratidesulfovibrio liaohensis]
MRCDVRRRCGAARVRMRYRIREALDRNGMDLRKVAEMAGVSPAAVQKVVAGVTNSPRILQALREAGVPEQYLYDPARAEANATEGKVA